MTFFATPPSEPGLYWIVDLRDLRYETGIPEIARYDRDCEIYFMGTDVSEWEPHGILWGDRIEVPTCE